MATKPVQKPKTKPRNNGSLFDVMFQRVVGVVAEGEGDLSPVDAAMLLISQQFTKEAEGASGEYHFIIPALGSFEVLFDFEPSGERIVQDGSMLDTSRFMDDLSDFSRKV